MSSELEHRIAIIAALRCGRTPKEVVNFLHFQKSSVCDIVMNFKEFEQTGTGP